MERPKMVSVEYVKEFILRLSFSDGMTAEVDFEKELTGGVFEALRDVTVFRSFTFQRQFGTIEWSDGADFAPEFLYEMARNAGVSQGAPLCTSVSSVLKNNT